MPKIIFPMAVVYTVQLLLVCGWISIINAQPNTITILPQEPQSVCPGESISFHCIGSGSTMALFSPPIVNETNALLLFSNQNTACRVLPNSVVADVFVDSASFMGIFTLYISPELSEGQRTVFCRITSADGTEATINQTTFSVLGAPSPVMLTSLNFQVLASSSENMTKVPVNVSWDSPENAQEFMLQIIGENTNYSTTIRLESSVIVFLPYGNYSATLCTINRCGKICPDNSTNFSIKPRQQRPDSEECNNAGSSNSVIAPAVVAGILGLFFILTFIYAVVVTVIICTSKKDKLSAQAIPTDEMKMQ